MNVLYFISDTYGVERAIYMTPDLLPKALTLWLQRPYRFDLP